MNWADWAILVILAISSLISLKRGFVKEALSLVIWVLAFVIAMLFSGGLATLLSELITTPSVREMVAFGLLFAATLVVGAMVNYLIGELVRMTGLSGTDRMFGMVFGVARGLIVVMALVVLLPSIVPVDRDGWWQESALIPHFLSFEGWARSAARETGQFFISLFN
jgi:membrane protein required for colicin V production